ncbi:MAG: hypothetical protein R2795_07955 [Saprospiraceae bacterium]
MQHPIDELFGRRLKEATAEVPEDMWARIATARNQARRRKRLLWGGAGMLLVAVGAVWLWPGQLPDTGAFPVALPTIETTVPERSALAASAAVVAHEAEVVAAVQKQSTAVQVLPVEQKRKDTAAASIAKDATKRQRMAARHNAVDKRMSQPTAPLSETKERVVSMGTTDAPTERVRAEDANEKETSRVAIHTSASISR